MTARRDTISIYDTRAVRAHCDRLGVPGREVRSVLGDYFKRGRTLSASLRHATDRLRGALDSTVSTRPIELVERRDSRVDGATKLVFATEHRAAFETVVLRYPTGRSSICVSSQVGCALRCQFCATGQMRSVVDLSRDEILGQVSAVQQLLAEEGRSLDNLVFMGMGEPLLNEGSVFAALDVLTSGSAFNLAPRSLLVSTVGLPSAMLRLHDRFPTVNVAVSLHSSRQAVRERLMPIARKHDLAELRTAMDRLASTRPKGVMVEYLVLDGVNDSPTDIDHLAGYLDGLRCHVNLIPYNPASDLPLRPATERRMDDLGDRLRSRGFPVTRRHSLGRDIEAACGQLIQRRNSEVKDGHGTSEEAPCG